MEKRLTIRNFKICEHSIKYEERKSPTCKLVIEVGEHIGDIRVQCTEWELWDKENDLWSMKVIGSSLIPNPKLTKYNKVEMLERNRKIWVAVNELYWRYFE